VLQLVATFTGPCPCIIGGGDLQPGGEDGGRDEEAVLLRARGLHVLRNPTEEHLCYNYVQLQVLSSHSSRITIL